MKRSFLVMMFFPCLVVYGCAAGPEITKLTAVKSFEKYSGGYLDKVMIVGKGKSDATRIKYEDHLAKALEKRKIDAFPSYTVIPDMKDLNLANIQKATRSAGVKAALVTKMVDIDEKEAIFDQGIDYRYTTTPRGIYMSAYAFGPMPQKYTEVRLETGLFDLESDEILWGATSAIMDPQSADQAIKDFTKAIIQQLVKDGYLR